MTEQEYTDQVVMPLLRQMGFQEVTYNHGVNEFGKDVLFVEYDRFLMRKYYAAQVKLGDISGGNSSQIGDIISHTVRAFEIDFNDLITKQKVAISEFYIMISGRFTGNAKEILLQDSRFKPYWHRVHFYEGHHIDELWAKNYADISHALSSLLREMDRNSRLSIEFLAAVMGRKIPLKQFATTAISNVVFLLGGFPEYADLSKQLEDLQEKFEINNGVMCSMLVIDPIRGTDGERARLQDQIPKIMKAIQEVRQILVTTLKHPQFH